MFIRRLKSAIVWILTLEARLVLRIRRPRIVAVTGTVGKTSAKDAIHAALRDFFYVRKSEKSFNYDIGVPLTILGCPNAGKNPLLWILNIIRGVRSLFPRVPYPDWLVIEVGAGEPGGIRNLARLLAPDVVVVTCLGEIPVHVEFFASPEELWEEKLELVRGLKAGGTLILGADDARLRQLKETMACTDIVTFGFSGADVSGSGYAVRYAEAADSMPVGISAVVSVSGQSFPFSIDGIVGRHLMQPVLAAFAVGAKLGIAPSRLAGSLRRRFTPPPGRMNLVGGVNGSLIIDDSYNSSPIAAAEALRTLASLRFPSAPVGRKVAVLGDMMELGKYTAEEHQKIGALAARSCFLLAAVGLRARGMAEGAKGAGMPEGSILCFGDSREAARALAGEVRRGDIVLIKGSQAARMERIVKALMNEPARAGELLVRQGKEWGGEVSARPSL